MYGLDGGIVARLAGIRVVGFRSDNRSWLLYRAVDYPMDGHQVAALMLLGRTAQETFKPGGNWPDSSPELDLPLTVAHRETAHRVLAAANITGSFTVLCPMATGTRKNGDTKVWPHWREQVVANDSGPFFLAAAVGAPVLGIYGVAVRPRRRPLRADCRGSADGWPTVDEVLDRLGRGMLSAPTPVG